jgi:hypothetical protein
MGTNMLTWLDIAVNVMAGHSQALVSATCEGGLSAQLIHFALDGWTQTDAVPFYLAPNSIFGRAVGVVLG